MTNVQRFPITAMLETELTALASRFGSDAVDVAEGYRAAFTAIAEARTAMEEVLQRIRTGIPPAEMHRWPVRERLPAVRTIIERADRLIDGMIKIGDHIPLTLAQMVRFRDELLACMKELEEFVDAG